MGIIIIMNRIIVKILLFQPESILFFLYKALFMFEVVLMADIFYCYC